MGSIPVWCATAPAYATRRRCLDHDPAAMPRASKATPSVVLFPFSVPQRDLEVQEIVFISTGTNRYNGW